VFSSETGCFLLRSKMPLQTGEIVYVLSVIGPVEQTGNVGIKDRIMHFLIYDNSRQFAITGKHPKTGEEQVLQFDSIEDLLDRCDASNLNSFLNTPINIPAACPSAELQRILKHTRDVLEDDSIKLAASSNNRRQSVAIAGIAVDEHNYAAPLRNGEFHDASAQPQVPPRASFSGSGGMKSNPAFRPQVAQQVYDSIESSGPGADPNNRHSSHSGQIGVYSSLDGSQTTYDSGTPTSAGVAVEGEYTTLQTHATYDTAPR
jgi:hypothetical protein